MRPFFGKSLNLRQILLATSFGAATILALPAPADAQVWARGLISEDQLLHDLQRRGFRRMSPPMLNRDVFVLDAVDPRGRPVRLIVSAFDGRIVDAHPQRGSRWSQGEPGLDGNNWRRDDWRRPEQAPEPWRDSRRERWREPPSNDSHARMPHDGWRQPRSGVEIDPEDDPRWDNPWNEQEAAPPPPARRNADRPRTEPPPVASRDPDLPAPTLRNPTVVKRSPTAIPKDPNEKNDNAARPPAVSTAPAPKPKPGQGTRDNPRVIDMAPKTPIAASPGAALPKAPPAPRNAPSVPPVAASPPPIVVSPPPMVPPATLE